MFSKVILLLGAAALLQQHLGYVSLKLYSEASNYALCIIQFTYLPILLHITFSYYLGQQECISPAVTALATSTLATTASTANTQGTIYICT